MSLHTYCSPDCASNALIGIDWRQIEMPQNARCVHHVILTQGGVVKVAEYGHTT